MKSCRPALFVAFTPWSTMIWTLSITLAHISGLDRSCYLVLKILKDLQVKVKTHLTMVWYPYCLAIPREKHNLQLPGLLLCLLCQLALNSLWHFIILLCQIGLLLERNPEKNLSPFWRLCDSLFINIETTLELSRIGNQSPQGSLADSYIPLISTAPAKFS